MKVMRLFLSWLIIFSICALVTAPLHAQEQVTPEATSVVIGDPPTPPEQPPVEGFNFWSWLTNNSVLVLAAGFGLILIVQNNQHRATLKDVLEHADKRSVDAIEAAHEALPEAAQDAINRALGVAEQLTEQFTAVLVFLRKATDGQPNEEPEAQKRE